MNTYFNLNVRVLSYYYLPLQVSSNDLKWSHRRRLNRQLGSSILKIHLRLVKCLLPYRSFTLAQDSPFQTFIGISFELGYKINLNLIYVTIRFRYVQKWPAFLLGVRSTALKQRYVGQYDGPDSFEQWSSWSEIIVNGSRLRLQPFWLWLASFPILCFTKASQITFKRFVQKACRMICGLQVSFL